MKSDAHLPALVEALQFRASLGLATPPDIFFRLLNSSLAEKLVVFKDQIKRPIGYLAWAGVNRESALRFLKSGQYPLYPYEWNDGGIALILDVAIQKRSNFDALNQMTEFIHSKRAIIFCKKSTPKLYFRQKDKLIRKRL